MRARRQRLGRRPRGSGAKRHSEKDHNPVSATTRVGRKEGRKGGREGGSEGERKGESAVRDCPSGRFRAGVDV